MKIPITDTIAIDEGELVFAFVRASGPGGQNVNRVASAVQLRFDVAGTPSLADPVRERLMRQAAKRINRRGILVIEAKRFRYQERNRADAVERLRRLIEKASVTPKSRKPTRMPAAAKERRLHAKQRRGRAKRMRRRIDGEE